MNITGKICPVVMPSKEIQQSGEYLHPCWIVHTMKAMRKIEAITYQSASLADVIHMYGYEQYPILEIKDTEVLSDFEFKVFRAEKNKEFEFFAILAIGDRYDIFFLKEWYSLTDFCREIEPLKHAFLLQEFQAKERATREE